MVHDRHDIEAPAPARPIDANIERAIQFAATLGIERPQIQSVFGPTYQGLTGLSQTTVENPVMLLDDAQYLQHLIHILEVAKDPEETQTRVSQTGEILRAPSQTNATADESKLAMMRACKFALAALEIADPAIPPQYIQRPEGYTPNVSNLHQITQETENYLANCSQFSGKAATGSSLIALSDGLGKLAGVKGKTIRNGDFGMMLKRPVLQTLSGEGEDKRTVRITPIQLELSPDQAEQVHNDTENPSKSPYPAGTEASMAERIQRRNQMLTQGSLRLNISAGNHWGPGLSNFYQVQATTGSASIEAAPKAYGYSVAMPYGRKEKPKGFLKALLKPARALTLLAGIAFVGTTAAAGILLAGPAAIAGIVGGALLGVFLLVRAIGGAAAARRDPVVSSITTDNMRQLVEHLIDAEEANQPEEAARAFWGPSTETAYAVGEPGASPEPIVHMISLLSPSALNRQTWMPGDHDGRFEDYETEAIQTINTENPSLDITKSIHPVNTVRGMTSSADMTRSRAGTATLVSKIANNLLHAAKTHGADLPAITALLLHSAAEGGDFKAIQRRAKQFKQDSISQGVPASEFEQPVGLDTRNRVIFNEPNKATQFKLAAQAVDEIVRLGASNPGDSPKGMRLNFNMHMAALEVVAVRNSGGHVAMRCKSGKDRAGQTFILAEAMERFFDQTGRMPKYDSKSDQAILGQKFAEVYKERLFHENAGQNAKGSNGIKDSSLTGMNHLLSILPGIKQDMCPKPYRDAIGKLVFKNGKFAAGLNKPHMSGSGAGQGAYADTLVAMNTGPERTEAYPPKPVREGELSETSSVMSSSSADSLDDGRPAETIDPKDYDRTSETIH